MAYDLRNTRRSRFKTQLARSMRLNPTPAERELWRVLRSKRFGGLRFRRQQPIGPYVVDFYCSAARLVIELDGGEHTDARQISHDKARTRWLEARGYRVVRFWNADILAESSAFEVIWRTIADAGLPLPEPLRGSSLPQGEGSSKLESA